jgi:hypothetical protein
VQRVGSQVKAAELGHRHEAAQVVQVGFHALDAPDALLISIIAFHTPAMLWQVISGRGDNAITKGRRILPA